MPRVSNELNDSYYEPMAVGPVAQADLTALAAAPQQIAAGGSFTTAVLYADGYKVVAVGATLAAAGSITIQRYLDTAGQVLQSGPGAMALVANEPMAFFIDDGAPFQSFTVTITNSASAPAALAAFALLLNAA